MCPLLFIYTMFIPLGRNGHDARADKARQASARAFDENIYGRVQEQ